jgi:hypothetical protein
MSLDLQLAPVLPRVSRVVASFLISAPCRVGFHASTSPRTRDQLLGRHVSPDSWLTSFSPLPCDVGSPTATCARTRDLLLYHLISSDQWPISYSSLPYGVGSLLPCITGPTTGSHTPMCTQTRALLPYLRPVARLAPCCHVTPDPRLALVLPPVPKAVVDFLISALL